VRDGRAYIINSDYFEYWQYDKDADPQGFHGSQVLIADVSNPASPIQVGSQRVDGEVTDTRMVGDVLYTVSKRNPDYYRYDTADWQDTTWVKSINVADPRDVREIDRVTFSGASTLIHVATQAIFVAGWDPNFYLTNPDMEQQTLVTYVDISDPTGKLQKRGTVYVPGQIGDKFKMDWFDGHLRVLSQRWDKQDVVSLHVITTAFPDQLKIDTTLPLEGVTAAWLQATRFDGARGFAFTAQYASAEQYMLYTIDLSQPLSPTLAGNLIVPLGATHVDVEGDRLLVLGQYTDNSAGNYISKTAVALFAVGDLTHPSQVALATLGNGYSWSVANSDYKAFKTFPAQNLILVPLDYSDSGQTFSGVQLVDWTHDSLVARGAVPNTGGVLRAFPVGDRLVAVGDLTVSTINALNRDQPIVTASLRLVHEVHQVFDFAGQEVQLVTDVYSGQLALEVRAFGPADDSPPVATLTLPFTYPPEVLRDDKILHLLGQETGGGDQVVRNVDLTDPAHPTLRGRFVVSNEFTSIYQPGWSWYNYYWSPDAGLPLRNQIIPATFRTLVTDATGRRDFQSELRFLDLRTPDDPHIAAGSVPMNDFPYVNKVTHGTTLYSTHVEQATSSTGAKLLFHVRSFADRVDVTDPDHPQALPSVNIPGQLVDVSDDGSLWYTIDYQWDAFGRRRNSLDTLRFDGSKATLVTVTPIADEINRAALRPGQLAATGGRPVGWNDRTIWLVAHKYPWWGVMSDTIESRQPYTVLQRIDFAADGTVASNAQASLAGYFFDLLDVADSRAYLASETPTGLLVLDVSQPASPIIVSSARTLGYISSLVENGGKLYAPLGMYGVQQY
jgi:hypothetical protein